MNKLPVANVKKVAKKPVADDTGNFLKQTDLEIERFFNPTNEGVDSKPAHAVPAHDGSVWAEDESERETEVVVTAREGVWSQADLEIAADEISKSIAEEASVKDDGGFEKTIERIDAAEKLDEEMTNKIEKSILSTIERKKFVEKAPTEKIIIKETAPDAPPPTTDITLPKNRTEGVEKNKVDINEKQKGGAPLNPEDSIKQLESLESPENIVSSFFDLYTDDIESWSDADIIPNQRRAVELWTDRLTEKMGGDSDNLENLQAARLKFLNYANENNISVRESLALRHVNWLFTEMNARFPQIAFENTTPKQGLTESTAENVADVKQKTEENESIIDGTIEQKLTKDLGGRVWSEMNPPELLHIWKNWTATERLAARIHPDISGYKKDIPHPDIIEIPGKQVGANNDILGSGGEGAAGITLNFKYLVALAKGSNHDQAFESTYGLPRSEWLENAKKDASQNKESPDKIDAQLRLYENQSEEMMKLNEEFYRFEPPQDVQFNKTKTAEKIPTPTSSLAEQKKEVSQGNNKVSSDSDEWDAHF